MRIVTIAAFGSGQNVRVVVRPTTYDQRRRRGSRRRRIVALAVGIGGAATVMRSKLLHWGARAEELEGALPGDTIVHAPHLVATRAITIRRSPAAVWPWVAQLGQGRGGFYSYDRLENLIGCNIHSADRVIGAWQDVNVGDEVRLAPDLALTVASVDAPTALVLRGGVPMGNAPVPYDFSWAFVLREDGDGVTRLVVRERYRYLRGWARLIVEPVAVISFVMTQKMLRGIRDRAEGMEPTVGVASSPVPGARPPERLVNDPETPTTSPPKEPHG